MSLWIKICANTSLADARLAAAAGADAVGFVFAPSPRRVTPEQVAAIAPHLPAALEKIGVFVDTMFDEIAGVVEGCSLTGVQLHWDAPAELPAKLRARFGPTLRILRVVHVEGQQSAHSGGSVSAHERRTHPVGGSRANVAKEKHGALTAEVLVDPNLDAILVDSRTATATGGTGQTYNWTAASKSVFHNPGVRKPLIAAGGLTPENVAEAIAALHPWGVDVVSGVEAAPGRKDAAKVREFVSRAREARTSSGESQRGYGQSD